MKQRSIGFVALVVLALLGLLAFSRSGDRAATAVETGRPATGTPAEAVRPDAQVSPASDEGPAPRHPEIGFRGEEQLREHFRKHGREFHAHSAEAYLRLAQSLRDRRRGGDVLEFVRNDAVTCKFDRATGAFVAYNSDGTLRTFFRPNDGEAYVERQKSRAHDSR
jgi:hypothetical protein